MRDLLAIAGSHRSVGNLLDALEADRDVDAARVAVADALDGGTTGSIPAIEPLLRDRVADAKWLPPAVQIDLSLVVDRAIRTPWRNAHGDLMRLVFGDQLSGTVAATKMMPRVQSSPDPPARLSRRDFEGVVQREIAALRESWSVLPEFAVSTDDAPDGFGEYWPTELSADATDRLVMHYNPDSARADTLRATLAHEVAGHAAFYTAVRNLGAPWFDHGAFALVEGWATWAEWHLAPIAAPGPETFGLIGLLDAECDEVSRRVPQLARARGYSDRAALYSLMLFSEHPGLQLSYVLGGLWLTRELGAPKAESLEFLRGRPLGDFVFSM